MLMPLLAQWSAQHGATRCGVLSPAYAEHARTARMAGLSVTAVSAFDDLHAFDHAVVINPNNPDGHVTSRTELLSLADAMREKGGLLVVDEAFIETGCGESLASHATSPGLVVLRSFGKFYGMAGVRLGFAVAHPELASELEARLGPWAVSGPALHIATQALADDDWRNAMRTRLRKDSERLNDLLRKADLGVVGGTPLFTLVRSERAPEIFDRLARHGILTRIFEERPSDIRFGLPATENEWRRLQVALSDS